MLKILFSLLLLINGGLFAFQHGYLDEWMPSNREPSRLKQQLHADQLQLLPSGESGTGTAPSLAPAPQNDAGPTPIDSAAAAALDNTVAAVAVKVAANGSATGSANGSANGSVSAARNAQSAAACTEIGNFDPLEATRFESRLAASSIKDKATRRPLADSSRHIVYMPPQGSRAGAEKKAAELKRLGVDDFFIIQDDSPLQWGISLGVFKTEEAARKQLAELGKKGVHSARISDRDSSTGRVAFRFSGLDAAARSALTTIKADFPRQNLRACTPTE